jgi:glycosyltransferase involved in cell wall biosynthesis
MLEGVRFVAQRTSLLDPFLVRAARKHTICLAENPPTAQKLERLGAKRIHVLSNQVSDCPAQVHEDSTPGKIRLLYAGALIYQRGIELGIRSIASLVSEGERSIHWDIIGDGPKLESYRQLVRELGLQEFIEIHGHIDRSELLEAYAGYDGYFFPSLRDACGTSVIEAMSHGLPVICFDNSGPGLLLDESCAVIVPTKGTLETVIQRLSTALKEFSASSSLRGSLRARLIPFLASKGLQRQTKAFAIEELYREAVSSYQSSPEQC